MLILNELKKIILLNQTAHRKVFHENLTICNHRFLLYRFINIYDLA